MTPATQGPRMLQGDEADLYRQHHHHLMNVIRSHVITADSTVHDDAAAHAWLQLLRCQPRRDTAFGWLCTVAVHHGWDLAARANRTAPLPEHHAPTDPVDTDLILDARHALAELAALPDRQRRYLTLVIAGHSYDDITRHHHVSYTSVNKHLARARRAIRQRRGPTC